MNHHKRLAVTSVSAVASLAVSAGLIVVAAPARADSAPASTVQARTAPAGVTQPVPKPKGPKAKVAGYKKLTKKAKKVANKVRNEWRQIKRIGGWRAGSRWSGDHPGGRAVDVMIPKWKTKKYKAVGWRIAKFFANKKNAKKYKIHYVIFRKKIWTVQTPRWRSMANRGGATANHLDHVHISVKR